MAYTRATILKTIRTIGIALGAIGALCQAEIAFAKTSSCTLTYLETNEQSVSDCGLLAEKGDADAQVKLARYLGNRGDLTTANKWLKMAAFQGNVQAIEHFRTTLFDKAQKSPSSAEMIDFLEKVVKIPSLDKDTLVLTQAQLCQAYAQGLGTVIDYKSAVYWCEQSAKNGEGKSAWELVKFHKNGFGVPKNPKKTELLWNDFLIGKVFPIAEREPKAVVTWYQSAAKIGICSASRQLANIYAKGLYKVEPSKEISNEWLLYTKKCEAIE